MTREVRIELELARRRVGRLADLVEADRFGNVRVKTDAELREEVVAEIDAEDAERDRLRRIAPAQERGRARARATAAKQDAPRVAVPELAVTEHCPGRDLLPSRKPLMQTNRERVLVALRAAGFDPGALPALVAGFPCPAKSAARTSAGLTDAAFEHAWKALATDGALTRFR